MTLKIILQQAAERKVSESVHGYLIIYLIVLLFLNACIAFYLFIFIFFIFIVFYSSYWFYYITLIISIFRVHWSQIVLLDIYSILSSYRLVSRL